MQRLGRVKAAPSRLATPRGFVAAPHATPFVADLSARRGAPCARIPALAVRAAGTRGVAIGAAVDRSGFTDAGCRIAPTPIRDDRSWAGVAASDARDEDRGAEHAEGSDLSGGFHSGVPFALRSR